VVWVYLSSISYPVHFGPFLVSGLPRYQSSSYLASNDGILKVSRLNAVVRRAKFWTPDFFKDYHLPKSNQLCQEVEAQFKTRFFSRQRGTASVSVTVSPG
jgi:hypothetical protein